MEILISFCNQQSENLKKNLLIFDTKNKKRKYLLETEEGFTGLAQDNDFFYALSQNAYIFIISKNNHKLIFNKKLENLSDPHSILIKDNNLLIVSSGNDEVLQYKFDKNKLKVDFTEVFWKIESKKYKEGDNYHLNSIFVDKKGEFYVSAFGEKEGERWSSAKNGYIFNITKDEKVIENIYHPHSVVAKNDSIYCCESALQNIKKDGDVIIKLKSGYARGLSLYKNYLVFGVSGGRKVSKSTGVSNEIAEAGLMNANCRVLIYEENFSSERYEFIDEIDFFPSHTEIYDTMIINYN